MIRLGINTLFYLPGEVGGSETYLIETLRALRRRAASPELVFFTNAENHDPLGREFPDAERMASGVAATNRFVRILAEQVQLPQMVRQSGVNVLWSPGYTAPARCPCRQVVSILDMQYKRFPQDVDWWSRRAMDLLYPLAARCSDAVVTISEFAKSDIVRFLKVDPGKVTVTLLAADPVFREPAGPPPGEAGEVPYILCVAHTYPHKNVATLVRAFGRIAACVPHRLVLVGQPRRGERDVLEALRRIPPGRVIRWPVIDRRGLVALYQGADWFVLPSLYEGFGLPVLEAMTAGTPVLTTSEASLPEVGGDCVLYADGRDTAAFSAALRNALAMPLAERRKMIAAGRRWAANYSWSASAGALANVLGV